jgi:hypothetical protein
MQFSRPSDEGDVYILIRINSFSREVDAVPLQSKSPSFTAQGMKELLQRAEKPEKVFTDMGTEWGGEFARLLDSREIDHGDKEDTDHSSFAVLDSAIRTIKLQLGLDKRDWAQKLPEVIREYNLDINDTTGTAPAHVSKNKEATFCILKQNSQNLLHNLADSKKREDKIREADGVRPLLIGRQGKNDPDRRKGPRERVDDPRWGDQRRLVDGPGAFSFGRVHTSDGQSAPTKLALKSKMAPAEPLLGEEAAAMKERVEKYMEQLWTHMIDETGPLSIADALEWLRDQGADLSNYKQKGSEIFKLFPEFFRLQGGFVLAHMDKNIEGIPVRLDMHRPFTHTPWKAKKYGPKYVAPLEFGDVIKPGLMDEIRSLDNAVFNALQKKR